MDPTATPNYALAPRHTPLGMKILYQISDPVNNRRQRGKDLELATARPGKGGTCENETSRAGLRPKGVYVYAEWLQGRANRPFLEGEHGCPDRGRTLEGKHAQVGK